MDALQGCRILVVEDDALLAMTVEQALADAGCVALGPATSLARGLEMAARGGLDAVTLDINLRGEMVFPLADRLAALGIPFLFLSGHSRDMLPARHRDRPFVPKPFAEQQLVATIAAMLREAERAPSLRNLA